MIIDNKTDNLEKSFCIEKIDKSWNDFFFNEIGKEKLEKLLIKLEIEWKNNKCYPEKNKIFRLFQDLPIDNIKVIILGQDPYHQFGIADGIAFSTQKENFIPASLKNIFIELRKDLNHEKERNKSSLEDWVKQGVFLINTSLTVIEGKQLSHSEIWKEFTLKLINYIKNYNNNIIWVFWGREAKILKEKCNINNNLIITSSHPSPFSASLGFFGSKPFSKINKMLESLKKTKINW